MILNSVPWWSHCAKAAWHITALACETVKSVSVVVVIICSYRYHCVVVTADVVVAVNVIIMFDTSIGF
jgi:hypothetical protein